MTTSGSAPLGHLTPLGLMSCVRESSPQELLAETDLTTTEHEKNEMTKKRRFHPFRGLRKMFRKKLRHTGSDENVPDCSFQDSHDSNSLISNKDAHKSRSTNELLAGDETARRKSGGSGTCPGLSISHDSVFTTDQHSISSDYEMETVQSSSSLSVQQFTCHQTIRTELIDVVRRRRGRDDSSEEEEDLGLPSSPCNSPHSPDKVLKEQPTKSHSTCSDGSLLSMGSFEMEEDSAGANSRHSSKLSLPDKTSRQSATYSADTIDLDLETGALITPLSHSAARHKMAVKPKRTHGVPRRQRNKQIATSALPTTIEVNEEPTIKSATPESNITRESVAELYSTSSMTKAWNASNTPDQHLKSASLPPGLALPLGINKLSRSRSNAGGKRGDIFPEEDEEEKVSKEDKKKEESFFGRFLARRSGKKQSKKSKSEDGSAKSTEMSLKQKYLNKRTISIDMGEAQQKMIKPTASNVDNGAGYTEKHEQTELSKKSNISNMIIKINKTIDSSIKSEKSRESNIFFSHSSKDNQSQKMEIEEYSIKNNNNLSQEIQKIKSEINIVNVDENQSKLYKKTKIDEVKMKLNDVPEKQSQDTQLENIAVSENVVQEKFSVKIKSNESDITKNDEKQLKRLNSDDLVLIKTNESLVFPKQNEEQKTTTDSNIRISVTPKTGPAARQRIQPIDIPASPDEFRGKRQQTMDIDIPDPPSNSPEQNSFLMDSHYDSSSHRMQIRNVPESSAFAMSFRQQSPSYEIESFEINDNVNITDSDNQLSSLEIDQNDYLLHSSVKHKSEDSLQNKSDDKSKIKIAGLSSYQQKVLSYSESDTNCKSLDKHFGTNTSKYSITKSHSFRLRSSSAKDFSYKTHKSESEIIEPTCSKFEFPIDDKKGKANKDERLTFPTCPDVTDTEKLYNQNITKNDNVTVSCINSQILSSTNSSNQVTVSINNSNVPNENSEIKISDNLSTQISVTRVHVKKECKTPENAVPTVPEFLKIQLNKVDIKPNSNIILSTSTDTVEEKLPTKTPCETETENAEFTLRKFSIDDVEIINKDPSEETVEIPKIVNNVQLKKDDEIKKQNTVVTITKPETKSILSCIPKPFQIKKIKVPDTSEHMNLPPLSQTPEKVYSDTNSETESIKEATSPTGEESVIIRRKSLASMRREKEFEEPELMKVFARRSLKLKDSEAETLSHQVSIMAESLQKEDTEKNNIMNVSRDSDKENEVVEPLQEEPKKAVFESHANTKETRSLSEVKLIDNAAVTAPKSNNKTPSFNIPRYQKTVSSINLTTVENNDDTRKIKSYIEKTEKSSLYEKNRTKIITYKDINLDTKITDVNNVKCSTNAGENELISNISPKNSEFEIEEYVPKFKKISQRKEEWEQRAQQAMKKTVP